VAALQLLALWVSGYRKWLLIGSALVGTLGCVGVVETGLKGGEIVYRYAGGVGTRSGRVEDVDRLLLAGLYNQAMVDRMQGKSADAAALIGELARRYPHDTTIRLLASQSLSRDTTGGKAAPAPLAGV